MAENQFITLLIIVVAGLIAIYYGFQSQLATGLNYSFVIVGLVLIALAVVIARKFLRYYV